MTDHQERVELERGILAVRRGDNVAGGDVDLREQDRDAGTDAKYPSTTTRSSPRPHPSQPYRRTQRQRGSVPGVRADAARSSPGGTLGAGQLNRSSVEAMPVLGAACTRSQETVRVPDYDAGPFGLTLRVRVPLVDNAPSFNDAIDHAAFALANDGWMIESVSHCAVIGIADQGFAFFQVVVTATRS